MNQIVRATTQTPPAFALPESELFDVLRNSLYPGAQDNSIKLVLSYCRAAGLDPMQKPVHIVPMWDSSAGRMRDVVMPGIGLYRTQAARTGELAGITEPEFGPEISETIGGVEISYPVWCKVTVKRIVGGQVAEFTACERWKENYAVKGGKEKSIAPNAMWKKRSYGQLAKCTQAQALRMAFPEMTGSAPTADEMEGKTIEVETLETSPPPSAPPAKSFYPEHSFSRNFPKWQELILAGKKTANDVIAMIESRAMLTEEQREEIIDIEMSKVQEPANGEESLNENP